jgi:hypothetical protein
MTRFHVPRQLHKGVILQSATMEELCPPRRAERTLLPSGLDRAFEGELR